MQQETRKLVLNLLLGIAVGLVALFILRVLLLGAVFDHVKDFFFRQFGWGENAATGVAYVALALAIQVSVWKLLFTDEGTRHVSYGLAVFGLFLVLAGFLATRPFFDQKTGQVMAWYDVDASGKIRIYDSDGYNTTTGAKRKPVDQALARCFSLTSGQTAPRQISPSEAKSYVFFDSGSGQARAYWANGLSGDVEVFEGACIHPRTGERLQEVNRDVVQRLVSLEEQKLRTQERERQERLDRMERDRIERKPSSVLDLYPPTRFTVEVIDTPKDFHFSESPPSTPALRASEVRYLTPSIKYTSEKPQIHTLDYDAVIKVTSPPRRGFFGPREPQVVQWVTRGKILPGTNGWSVLGGWGTERAGEFWGDQTRGVWTMEVLVQDRVLASTRFTLE